MSVQFNHTIIGSRDNRVSAEYFAELLGLKVGKEWGPFIPIELENGVTLDFANVPEHIEEIQPQHYAFLVSDEVFDRALGKIRQWGQDYWADPRQQVKNDYNTNDGGRGFYFLDPAGHYMELITVPYGGWSGSGSDTHA
ncbi:VOC family protein [Haloglycomyces albus]|uniref:VOC family protein n=1 Tax=Haloglycomyces albus TaxID=526067 RepID=UPI00046D4322|nr:VOC family protein [Haloglycomyces albus]